MHVTYLFRTATKQRTCALSDTLSARVLLAVHFYVMEPVVKSSYVTLTCFVLATLLNSQSFAQDGDIAAEFTNALPNGWTCALSSDGGTMYCNVTTSEMETAGSQYGQAAPGTETGQLILRFKVLPRYTSAMVEEIKKHNAPLQKQLKSLDYYSAEYREVSRKLIDIPQFMDSSYGYQVEYLSRVPKNDADKEQLVGFLKALSKDWTSVDPKKQPADELIRILTQ